MKNYFITIIILFFCSNLFSQASEKPSTEPYKKRVLESVELELLGSYYTQDGEHAAVTGGIGTEALENYPVNVVVSIPVGADNILAIDAGVSAYSSASSSNLNPFDGTKPADAYVASTGASTSDELLTLGLSFTHFSDDRNTIWSLNAKAADEHDYLSYGFGGSLTRWFNNKNTSVSLSANIFLDEWKVLYPYELGGPGGDPEVLAVPDFNLADFEVTGNPDYQPVFKPYENTKRNTYALGLGFSQIINSKMQGALSLDLIRQSGQLGNHMQRVYFGDVEDSFIESFHLADDIERLPSSRLKTAVTGKLNYYINENFLARTSYRFYLDNWGIQSHTFNLEVPIKPFRGLTLYPAYRFYTQTAAKYFAPYEAHLSTDEFYTSDYDLSSYQAHQLGFGISYGDPFGKVGIGKFRFKSIDLKYNHYWRNSGFSADIYSVGLKFSFGGKR